MFPVEIWEIILEKFEKDADPIQLVRLKRVSKSWYGIITQLLQKTGDKWYEKCVKRIPERFWSGILEQRYYPDLNCTNFHESSKHPYIWISLYSSWLEWKTLMRKIPVTETFAAFPHHRNSERITCVAASNNIVAIGDSEGHVAFYDITKFGGSPIYKANHGDCVRDLQFWREGNDLTAVSACVNNEIKFWDVNGKTEKYDDRVCRGSMISSSFEYCYIVDTADGKKDEAMLHIDQWREFTSTDRRRLRLTFKDKYVAVGSDRDKVMLWMEGKHHIKYSETETETFTLRPFMIRKPAEPNRCYLAFKPCVAACIGEIPFNYHYKTVNLKKKSEWLTEKGGPVDEGFLIHNIIKFRHFGFSIAGRQWKMYDSLEKFSAPVTAILYHVVLLILGLSSGEVYIFHVNHYDNLENYKFRTAESKKLVLDTEAITSLKVAEYGTEKCLVAATDRKLHLVKFRKIKN